MRKKQIIMFALSLLLLIQPFVPTKTNLAQAETIEVFKPNEISSGFVEEVKNRWQGTSFEEKSRKGTAV